MRFVSSTLVCHGTPVGNLAGAHLIRFVEMFYACASDQFVLCVCLTNVK